MEPPFNGWTLGCHGNFSHLKKAGLNRLDKIGFFQTIFEKTHRKSKISQQPKFSLMFSFFFFLQDTRAAVLPFVFLSKTYTEGINSPFFSVSIYASCQSQMKIPNFLLKNFFSKMRLIDISSNLLSYSIISITN